MKICAYVQGTYAKETYKNECLDSRQFVGLRVIMDALQHEGYDVEWAGSATVHQYDIVLVSLTADCDWWPYIQERIKWRKGNYKVIIGGAGVLHVEPFLQFADYFSLGRGEWSIPNLIKKLDGKPAEEDNSIVESRSFSPDNHYTIRQTDHVYENGVVLTENNTYHETAIGCNHKCLFCGYTWHRKFVSNVDFYKMGSGLFDMSDVERAMLDLERDPNSIDWVHLRSTAIDGFSERLRYMVNKRISKKTMMNFVRSMIESEGKGAKPHQMKLFNICGYPTETDDDMWEYLETIKQADMEAKPSSKQWSIVLSSTHFRPMPATPLACAPMSKKNYRGYVSSLLGKGLKGNLIYQGRSLWSVEGMGTESLPPVMLSAIAHRGSQEDTENIVKLCKATKFWNAPSAIKEATLEKYFNLDKLFGSFTPETLPSRYLRTYCAVERMWEKPIWEERYAIKPQSA